MPLPFLPFAIAAAGAGSYWFFSKRQPVDGYVDGQLTRFVVSGIGEGARLRVDAATAFMKLQVQAAADGFELLPSGPRSGFRTMDEQQALLAERGSFGAGGFAAQPGHSPHQAGYALDVKGMNAAADDYNPGLYSWLRTNGPDYGWFPKGDSFSTKEPWHFEFSPGTGAYA